MTTPIPEELEESLDYLRQAVQGNDGSAILKICDSLHYADLASAFVEFSEEEQIFFQKTYGSERFADIFAELPDTILSTVLNRFNKNERKQLLKALNDDDRVDILQDLSDKEQRDLLSLLPDEDEALTRTLLRYEEDTAGGRMTTHFGKVRFDLRVKEALDILREHLESTETLARIFVLDHDGVVLGKLRMRDIAFSTWDTPVSDIMVPVEHQILATADQEEAGSMFARYDLIVLPVVDEANRILGVITHDDAIEILEEESTEDFEKVAGIAGDSSENTYLNTNIRQHFSRRVGWLVTLAILAIASGYVMLEFEHTLSTIPLLALFLPMVIAAGGNTGGQASTMIIRSMTLGELDVSDLAQVALKELKIGVILGLILGTTMAFIASFGIPAFKPTVPENFSYPLFALAIGMAMMAQVTTSAVIGGLLPLLAKSVKLDPVVVASPAITTIVDVTGMVIYFTIARAVLGV